MSNIEEYNKNTQKIIINHFFDKILKLKDAMQTNYARKEAKKRHNFIVDFLRNYFEEQDKEEWIKYLDKYLNTGNK